MTTHTTGGPSGVRPFDVRAAAPVVHAAMAAFDAAASEGLEPSLAELVRVRASQLNGCALCLSMHTGAARRAGEDERRLRALASWRGSPLFEPAERAALELTEAVTVLGDGGVPERVLAAARGHFDDTALAHLLWTIAAINAWNRVGIAAAAAAAGPDRDGPDR
ncbi:carboxymuconolactone decarboxylase family protein [Actinomadura sp. WMMB 499]|uniref:carboxymuconolactone decarboxylase family protein n=1 Tax=Actinomadura sp. WMMB 499 TaxID=1219491 RepID=UPI001244DB35|nr:carboxymuconolactone decarboxylase family protein [Actinomadura sp. WMMB 499]QFG22598.1 carboxymuconolactone decarboxylase family protein [Actinomadura sp. WMMB 499]